MSAGLKPKFGACLKWLAVCGIAASISQGASREVSLELWLADALLRDPALTEALAESSYEQSRAKAVPIWEDPELRLGIEDREDRADQREIRLRMPVPNPWEARAIRRRAEARAGVEMDLYDAMEWERRIALSTLYYESVYAWNRLTLRTTLLEGMKADLADADEGLGMQAMAVNRVIDLRAEHAITAARRAKDEVEWTTRKEELSSRAGWKADTISGLSTPLPAQESVASLPALEDLNRRALRDNSSLKAIASEQLEDQALRDRARANAIPWFSFLEGTWSRESQSDRNDFQVRIGVSLPVFTWLRGSQTEAAFRVLRSRERLNAQRMALESALQTARHRAEACQQRLRVTHEATEQPLLEIEILLQEEGVNPRIRTNMRDLHFDLQSERLEAALDYQLALLDLMMVTGPGFSY